MSVNRCRSLVRRLLPTLLPLVLLVACGTRAAGEGLDIYAAASLTNAFDELAELYEAESAGGDVRLNFAGSSQLATQLLEGARADLFASANESQLARLVEVGLVDPARVETIATNRLVLVVPADNPAGIETLADLARPGVRLVGAAEVVPIGGYFLDVLDRAAADPAFGPERARAIRGNVVSEESDVRQIVAKIQLGEGDAALVYDSDVTEAVRDDVRVLAIPDHYNVTVRYFAAPIEGARQPVAASRFMTLLTGDRGREILARWGFGPP